MSKFSLCEVLNMLEDDQLQCSDDLFDSSEVAENEQLCDVDELHVPDYLSDDLLSELDGNITNTLDNVNECLSSSRERNLKSNPDTIPMNVYDTSELPESQISEKAVVLSTVERHTNLIIVEENEIKVFTNLDRQSSHERDEVIYTNQSSSLLRDKFDSNKNQVSDENNNLILGEGIDLIEGNADNTDGNSEKQSDFEESVQGNTDGNVQEIGDNAEKTRSRKRVKDPRSWQKTIRKRRRQAGNEYTNVHGKSFPKKTVTFKKDCNKDCRRNCQQMFTSNDIEVISRNFWSLNDNMKYSFFAQTTERVTKKSHKADSRRKFTYKYFFVRNNEEHQKVQVCKDFYLGVLQVSDKRIRLFYEKQGRNDGTQFTDLRGTKTRRRTPDDRIEFVKQHINSFPKVPSHYCRSTTDREYLEAGLSLAKMYELYLEKCIEANKTAVKIKMYRKIFEEDFNISFHKPKKDICDTCGERKENESAGIDPRFISHENDKIETRTERENDRQRNDDEVVVCFDLENVFQVPKATVSNFFYKRKLNVFNLTAHCSKDKVAYNAVWNETISGRGANEIASAIVEILKQIKQSHTDIKSFILWSDSCVPQNRNSVMSFALKQFMKDYDVESITQKFCCPGHSSIQEVDSIHSVIERGLRHLEYYSPVSLIRLLKAVRRKNPFRVIQLQSSHFKDYQKSSSMINFQGVPFTKVKVLKYCSSKPLLIEFKLAFSEQNFQQYIMTRRQTRTYGQALKELPIAQSLRKLPIIPLDKKKDLTSMLKYMPNVDQEFYRACKLVL